MDVDEEWEFSAYSSSEESDDMDIDIDLWSDAVEDVEMIDGTSDGNDWRPVQDGCLGFLSHRWGY